MVSAMSKKRIRKPTSASLKYGYRSGLESINAEELDNKGIEYSYEKESFEYTIPESKHKYTPDFIIETASGKEIIIETKGRFVIDDRKKHLLIKEQHPDRDIRFVFSNSRGKIRKGSKTTYGMWCEKNGFLYADKLIPKKWLDE